MKQRARLSWREPAATLIEVGGRDITNEVVGVKFEASPDGGILTLDLFAPDVEVDGEVDMKIGEETTKLLIKLGWTPPRSG
jgi:hypothetical protein